MNLFIKQKFNFSIYYYHAVRLMRAKIRSLYKKLILTFPLYLFILISCGDEPKTSQTEIEYKMHNYKIVSENCDTAGRCAYVEFNYPVFTGPKNLPSKQILNSYVTRVMLADGYTDSVSTTVDELGKGFLQEYEYFLSEFTDYEIEWALERDIKIVYNSNGILSLEFYEYSFMGGAHPNTVKTYQSFDLNTGAKIVIDDRNIMNRLNKIAEIEFRKKNSIPDNVLLSSAGYWFENDEFKLNDNFALVGEGLVFYFNPYEIGPYALGPTEIKISKDELGDLFKKILKN
jgi:hypothetical protein